MPRSSQHNQLYIGLYNYYLGIFIVYALTSSNFFSVLIVFMFQLD